MSQPNETESNTTHTVARTPTNTSFRPTVSTPTSDKVFQEPSAKSLLDSFVPSAEDLEPYLSVCFSMLSKQIG